MEGFAISDSARRHNVTDADIAHAWRHAIRLVEYECDGEDRLLIIGSDTHGGLVELVAVPGRSPVRIIHADRLCPSRYDFLR